MTTAQAFGQFLANIRVDKAELISSRYQAITKKLNKLGCEAFPATYSVIPPAIADSNSGDGNRG